MRSYRGSQQAAYAANVAAALLRGQPTLRFDGLDTDTPNPGAEVGLDPAVRAAIEREVCVWRVAAVGGGGSHADVNGRERVAD